MDQRSAGPVGRLWEVQSDRLREPGAAETFYAAAMPAIDGLDRDRGRILMVDRSRGVMRNLSIAADTDVWLAPTMVLDSIGPALRELTWSSLRGPLPFHVSFGRFLGVPVDPSGMVARMVMLEGGDAASPAVTAAIREHLEREVLPAPGCVAAVLMTDHDRSALLMVTVWEDAASADAVADQGLLASTTAVAEAEADLVDAGSYEVLGYLESTTTSFG